GSWVTRTDTRFVYDGWNLVAEVGYLGTAPDAPPATSVAPRPFLRRTYLWGQDLSGSLQGAGGVGGLLAITRHEHGAVPSKDYWVTGDLNGNVIGLTTENGLRAFYEYDPFGKPLRVSEPEEDLNPFRFSAKYTDAETGLSYYGYRYYDAVRGRWINRDPIGEKGGVNLQGMLKNNTPNQWDILGLSGADIKVLDKAPNCIVLLRQMHGPKGASTYAQKWFKSAIDLVIESSGNQWSTGLYEMGYEVFPRFYGRLAILSCNYKNQDVKEGLWIDGVKDSPLGGVGFAWSATDVAPEGLDGKSFSNGGYGEDAIAYFTYLSQSWEAAQTMGKNLSDKCKNDICCKCSKIIVKFEAANDDAANSWNNEATLPTYTEAVLRHPQASLFLKKLPMSGATVEYPGKEIIKP
ncbi:RHS repeat-associated core domain-containing protein, partial [Verrucomicrobium sp. BvORR106]|uniref:RHS repeat domain-containing protein n=1 Tax=Verrucomicrobium sp. BvORR106 TaxID=1403819 RepID=UPI0005711C42